MLMVAAPILLLALVLRAANRRALAAETERRNAAENSGATDPVADEPPEAQSSDSTSAPSERNRPTKSS